MRDWTTTGLLATIKRRAFLPDSNGPFTDAELLAIADEQLDEVIIPALEAVRDEYYVTSSDVSIVGGQSEYRIPDRAIGGMLRDLTWIDSSGNGVQVAHENLERRDLYGSSSYGNGVPAITIQGDHVVVLPAPVGSVGTLRFRYYRRPGKLVPVAEAARITSILGAVYTCANVPAGWDGDSILDVIDGSPTFEGIVDSEDPSAVVTGSSGTVTLDAAASGVGVGDYFALEGESPIPQIPDNLHGCLAQAVVVAVFLAHKDSQKAAIEQAKLQGDLTRAVGQLTPRVQGSQQRTVAWNSPLRSAMRGGR